MHDSFDELERELSRELASLPERMAPATLLPRVLRAIEREAALPWWRRSWREWPSGAQAALLIAGFVMLGGWVAALWLGANSGWAEQLSAKTSPAMDLMVWSGQVVMALGEALYMILASAGGIFWATLLGVTGLMYLSSLGLGAVCIRLSKKLNV